MHSANSGKESATNLVFHFACIHFNKAKAWDGIMLSRCANVECSKPFLRLREGRLFLVETDRLTRPGESAGPPFVRARQKQRQVEHFWLCDDCAAQFTLIYERERGVVLLPLRRPAATARAASASGRGVA